MLRTTLGLRHLAQRLRGIAQVVRVTLLAMVLVIVAGPSGLVAQVRGTFLHSLSNFGGRLPYDWVRVSVDRERDETYILYQNVIRIFNGSGMEVFSFGDDLDLGHIVDAVVDGKGDIILLSYKDSRPLVTRCDFRGVPIGAIEISKLPDSLVFNANRMTYRDGLLYFAALNAARVIVTDATGEFREHLDLGAMLDLGEKQLADVEMIGFSVDADGNIYFTIPVFFKAYKLTPDKKLTSFGQPGSAPGRFGVVAGIVADSRGNVLVADKLKSVVMVFDRDFRFVGEFGYRGAKAENLIVPDDLAIDRQDRLYVTQGRRRGVSVFALAQ